MDEADLPEGFALWPKEVQDQWLKEYYELYFPVLRWWDKPETDDEDSGPRPKQLPPDHPRHAEADNRGYRCGCSHGIPNCEECPPCPGNPEWSIWLCKTARGTGKALDSGTMIPTPSGWKTLAEVVVGDEVFDESGHVCRVTATFDIMPDEAYRLTFSDGTTLDACAEHQWVTWDSAERRAFLKSPYEDTSRFPANWPAWRLKRLPGRAALAAEIVHKALALQAQGLSAREVCRRLNVSRNAVAPHLAAGLYVAREPKVYPDSPGPQVRTTAGIVKTLTAGARGDTNHCIPVCGSLDLPEAGLPVDPYVLGAWLGDGNSADARVTIGDDDAEDMLALLAAAGAPLAGIVTRPEGTASAIYPIGCRTLARDPLTGRMVSNDSLHSRLRLLGVLRNKHVPAVYLRASAAQRLALLQGLMDTDGGWVRSGMVEFGSSSPRLAQAVVELARSLGQKPVSAESRAMLHGKDCGPRWRVSWSPTVQVFRLRRKADRFAPGGAQSLRKHHRMIVSAELIDPKPMRCLTVDSPHSMYLAGEGMIPTHNTKAGSNWVLEMALSKPNLHVGICAPRYDDVRGVCIEGQSGLLAEARQNGIKIADYNKNLQVVALENGSVIRGFSAEKPESIRGQNLSYVWFDELASIRYFEFYHEGLMPALRLGDNPRMLITTTPKRVRLIRTLVEESKLEFEGPDGGPGTGVHLTEAVAAENVHFSRKRREWLERKYAGNPVMLAQELRGEMLGEVDGALFPIDLFNEYRVYPDKTALPQWRRVVVAIDPATTSKDSSDESGVVVMAEGDDGDFYCLEDCSGKFSPDQQMKVVAEAYYRNAADCVVGEVNMTGDYMRALLSTVDPNIPLRTVHGMRGKVSRAQGASSLFAQGRIHMVGDSFRLLEDQLSAMAEGDDRSRMKDDRADAFVWAMIHLAGSGQGDWGLAYGFRDCVKCGSRVNEDKDSQCPNCGAEVTKMAPKAAGGRPAREPWSVAYLNTCPKCETKYSPKERSCPNCSISPETYLARAMAMQSGNGGRLSYTGKNWFGGRRI